MKSNFYEIAEKMLSGAGFMTADNKTFTLNQKGYYINKEVNAVFIVELDEKSDNVFLTFKTSAWQTSPATEKFERFSPYMTGSWKTPSGQAFQLKTYFKNNGCNADFPNIL